MAKQFKFIKDLFPMTKGWTVKVSVVEKTMPRESQHSSNRYQRLISVDSEACVLCAGSSTLVGKEVHFISDSMVAVSWVNGSDFGCLKHVKLIYDIKNLLCFLGRTSVLYNSRSSNSFADSLAKKGSNMEGDSVKWSLD
ncbi:hypothetical protein Dsin_013689 [Dipteronia sinensis]|uniref:Uncharacterized protein n=1 Tax=Dipteronia sinensis TaxID=43782 RepID=A0AAE0ALN5_9ROSI|nr:hypothetical protein Dsin_013689 [Dipteronia sinensis]